MAQLGDLQIDITGAGLPEAVTVAVAAIDSVGALDVEAGAAQALDIELHHALGDELDHLLEQISIRPFLNQLGQCHSGFGHRGFPGEG
ncbi:hypothetical protein FQZ97_1244050 [compost metagenome]